MIDIFLRAGEHPIEFIFCILLALVPTVTWFLIFGQRHKCRWPYVLITLFAGMCAGGLVLSYQYFWGSQFDFIFFSLTPHNFQEALQSQVQSVLLGTLLVFLSIGFIEEYAKHWLVKMTDHKIFESIDDVIELSIIGALGFAMLENIGYFFMLVVQGEHHNIIQLFVIRSIFVVFVHILCSGIYGYFYGLGFFAKPLLEKREREGEMPRFPMWVHKVVHLKKVTVFKDEMATLGLFIAMTIHGLYDFLLEVGTFGKLTMMLFGMEPEYWGANVQMHVFLLPAMLFFGFSYLSYLLNKKEDQKRWGHLETREVFIDQEKESRPGLRRVLR